MFRVDFAYSIGDQIEIILLETAGVVTSLWYGDRGPQYEVAYFVDGERKREYLFACEIRAKKGPAPAGFPKDQG